MPLLQAPPTLNHLSRMYFELAQRGARSVGEKKPWPYKMASDEELVCLAAEMSRYDPRLFDILVEFVLERWQQLNPLKLRRTSALLVTPQTLAAVFAFSQSAQKNSELKMFARYVTQGLRSVSHQLYFINLHQPASNLMQQAAEKPIQEFLKWGFLARERPVIHGNKRSSVGNWNPATRQTVIRRLVERKKVFSIADYLAEIDYTITRQQALKDLQSSKLVKMTGRGRGVRWKKKES